MALFSSVSSAFVYDMLALHDVALPFALAAVDKTAVRAVNGRACAATATTTAVAIGYGGGYGGGRAPLPPPSFSVGVASPAMARTAVAGGAPGQLPPPTSILRVVGATLAGAPPPSRGPLSLVVVTAACGRYDRRRRR